MKRIIASLLSVLIAFSLIACSKDTEDTSKEQSKETTTSQTTTKEESTTEEPAVDETTTTTVASQNTTNYATTAPANNTTKATTKKTTTTTRDTYADTKNGVSTIINDAETRLSEAKGYCDASNYNYALTSASAALAEISAAVEACKTDSRLSSVQASLQTCKDQLSGITKYYGDDSDEAHKAISSAITNASKSLSTAKTQMNKLK